MDELCAGFRKNFGPRYIHRRRNKDSFEPKKPAFKNGAIRLRNQLLIQNFIFFHANHINRKNFLITPRFWLFYEE